MENTKVVKKTMLYFIGNFSSKILTSVLVPIYAFYISAEALGIYDYSQTIMNIAIPIVFVSIWESIIRFILGQKDGENKNKVFGSSAFFALCACIYSGVCIIIISLFIKMAYINYFIVMICSTALAQIWQYYARALERNKLYVITSVIGTVINLLLNIVLIIILDMDIEALYISYICSQLSIFLILEYKLRILKRIKGNIDFNLLKKMLIYSAPLVLNSIAAWMFNGFGRIIIFENLGAFSNGIYSFANKFANIITTIGNVVSMAILEEAMISLRDNKFDSNYPKLLEQVFKIFMSLIIVAMPAIAIFYQFIDTTQYYESLNLVPFLLMYSVLLTMSINIGIIFKSINKNKHQVITTVIGSIVMLGVSYWSLNVWGVYGVVLGQAVSALVMLLSRYIISKRLVTYSMKWLAIGTLIVIYIFVSLISVFCSNIIIMVSIFILTIFIAIFANKDFLQELIKWRKKNA